MVNNSTLFVGLDLGDKFSQVFILDGEGEVFEESRVPTTKAALQLKFASLRHSRIALEVGAHSRWVSHLLKDLGHEVLVADARKLRLIYHNPRKSDRVDAETLARLGRLDPKLLSPVHHRTPEAQAHLAIIRARDALVRARTLLINHVRGTVKSTGTPLPAGSAASFHNRIPPAIPESLHPALNPILDTIADLTHRIQAYDRQVEALCQQHYPETNLLRRPQGVGPVTALAYVLTLEDPHRFAHSRDVGPCLGLVPRRDQSGDRDPQLRITKTGDSYLRRLLVGSAQYILGPFGPDCDLRRWGLKLAARGGKYAKKRAVVALARKLAVLLHRLWLTGEIYDPFHSAHAPSPVTAAASPSPTGENSLVMRPPSDAKHLSEALIPLHP
ncbi:MAG TPA: IS110 family transposase [Anaerolineales bacterium]|nr:IS110 family transposase [Anaerolineales bacterium]